ncbi:endonuclease/exonuclease/phosphatase family protein [Hymenobacter sp.]|uniref:endonuclease/exonuclease/phosphatase family protein n=1 Tax=Hymenobacter sp. TaxID=1898978 RepID=UPI00286C51B2|nr:endonuclease/exonuclease/phosphatase family protein [Hymenobacter sp.]
MKIITWNCNMAFRRKAAAILAERPDVLIVPECEHPDKLRFDASVPPATSVVWQGTNPNKGLGVFSYGSYSLRLLDLHNLAFRTVLPLQVNGPVGSFTLLAIWANHPADRDGAYVTQIWKALQHYPASLLAAPVVLAGDFNSNAIWDRPRRVGNHSDVVRHLAERGIHSAYHRHYQQLHGQEQHPTWYMYRHADKPYHLDYCFASQALLDQLQHVEICDPDKWLRHSDHVPVMVSFADILSS